jgi:hypothetical protein
MCSHCCLYCRRPIPSRLSNELFDWPIGKTESQSEIMFKGQLGSLITTIFVSLVSILRTQSGYSTMQKSWSDHFSNLREEFLKTFSTIAYNNYLIGQLAKLKANQKSCSKVNSGRCYRCHVQNIAQCNRSTGPF